MGKLDQRRHPVAIDAAKSLGILFDATLPENRDIAIQFSNQFKQNNKSVKLFGYFDNKQDITNFPFKAFNKNDIDWLLRPKGLFIDQFLDEPFDFLICIYTGECLPIEYISALSKAHLRVGPYTDNTYCYDLMIDTAGKESLKEYLKQVSFYLKRLKNKEHETTAI